MRSGSGCSVAMLLEAEDFDDQRLAELARKTMSCFEVNGLDFAWCEVEAKTTCVAVVSLPDGDSCQEDREGLISWTSGTMKAEMKSRLRPAFCSRL